MQQHQIEIKANQRPETLERLLRVIRHRGFEIVALNTTSNGQIIQLTATVQSSRTIELLTHQLVKLYDVLAVKIDG